MYMGNQIAKVTEFLDEDYEDDTNTKKQRKKSKTLSKNSTLKAKRRDLPSTTKKPTKSKT